MTALFSEFFQFEKDLGQNIGPNFAIKRVWGGEAKRGKERSLPRLKKECVR